MKPVRRGGKSGTTGRGRRASLTPTRQIILAEASEAFAAAGANGVSIRQIASRAAVDPALIYYFFGDKKALFREVIDFIAVDEAFEVLDRQQAFGTAFIRWYLGLWENAWTGARMSGLLRLAMTDQAAVDAISGFIHARVLPHLRTHATVEADADGRAALAASYLLGVAMHRYVLRIPELAERSLDALAALAGPVLDAQLGGAAPARPVQPTEE